MRKPSFLQGYRPNECGHPLPELTRDELKDVPAAPGVYIISSPTHSYDYPKGKSRVFYIGKSDNLKVRLRTHLRRLRRAEDDTDNEYWFNDRYNYMKYHGAEVYYYRCKGKQDAKNMESDLLVWFYDRHRATPVANGARSYKNE